MESQSGGLSAALRDHERVALDTAPLIYFIEGIAGRWEPVRALLRDGAAKRVHLFTSVVTEAEMLVGPLRHGKREAAGVIRELFGSTGGPRLVDLTRSVAWKASELRAERGLTLPDAVVVASALDAECSALVGNDAAFRRVGDVIAYMHLDDFVEIPS
ncbi:MAG TPA: PIN domain-containing protein [Actinomycetota bacterium]